VSEAGAALWGALLGAILGGALTVAGSYLAEQRQHRRTQRAKALTDLGSELALLARLSSAHPEMVGGDDYKASSAARTIALSTSHKDAYLAQAMVDAGLTLRTAVEQSIQTWPTDTYGQPEYDGRLDAEVETFQSAIDSYLGHLTRKLARRFERRHPNALQSTEIAPRRSSPAQQHDPLSGGAIEP